MSDTLDTALARTTSIHSLLLTNRVADIDVAKVLREATIERTIDGASTLILDIYDDDRTFLKSGVFADRTVVSVDGYTFELVQVRKLGNDLSLVFEDLPVAALRRRKDPLKISPNTVTHIDFAERLVKEEPWLNFWVPPELRSAERSRTELARGNPDVPAAEAEDSWMALGRIAEERGWRRFAMNMDTIAYVPETYLVSQPTVFVLREGTNGVDNIDFDFDVGKPVATATLRARTGRWAVPIGTAITVEGLGPADGNWLVSGTTRSLFSLFVDVTLTRARPVLPEPEASVAAAGGVVESAGGGAFVEDPSTYPSDPSNLVKLGQGNHRLIPAAAASFHRVEEAVGRQIPITDSYRSTRQQAEAYAKDPSRFSRPGGSAHGEGRAVDVDLRKFGVGNQSQDPKKWANDTAWKRLNDAFTAEGWCNYQYHNGSTKGKTPEPWHWAYKVCK